MLKKKHIWNTIKILSPFKVLSFFRHRSTNIQTWQLYTIPVQLKYQTALEIIWNNQRLCVKSTVKETKRKVWLSTVRMTSYMSFQAWINIINDKTTAGEANSWSAVLHWESIDAATMPCCLNWALIIWFFDFHSSICVRRWRQGMRERERERDRLYEQTKQCSPFSLKQSHHHKNVQNCYMFGRSVFSSSSWCGYSGSWYLKYLILKICLQHQF